MASTGAKRPDYEAVGEQARAALAEVKRLGRAARDAGRELAKLRALCERHGINLETDNER